MSTSKEEIKEEIIEMFYTIMTGDTSSSLEKAHKIEAYWNSFLTQVEKGIIYMEEGESK